MWKIVFSTPTILSTSHGLPTHPKTPDPSSHPQSAHARRLPARALPRVRFRVRRRPAARRTLVCGTEARVTQMRGNHSTTRSEYADRYLLLTGKQNKYIGFCRAEARWWSAWPRGTIHGYPRTAANMFDRCLLLTGQQYQTHGSKIQIFLFHVFQEEYEISVSLPPPYFYTPFIIPSLCIPIIGARAASTAACTPRPPTDGRVSACARAISGALPSCCSARRRWDTRVRCFAQDWRC
jgi:hypothetical protein